MKIWYITAKQKNQKTICKNSSDQIYAFNNYKTAQLVLKLHKENYKFIHFEIEETEINLN